MKILIKLLLVLSFFFITSSAQAECSTCLTNRETFSDQLKIEVRNNQATRQAEIQERTATRAGRLTETKKGLVRNYFRHLKFVLDASVRRMERLITRIETRLTKIETADKSLDTTHAKEELAEAKKDLASVSATLVKTETSLETVLSSEEPKDAFESIRISIKEVKTQLIDIHRQLVKIIGDIKGLRVGEANNE